MKSIIVFILIIAALGGSIYMYFKNIGLQKVGNQEPSSYSNYKPGDVNRDGKIDATDKFIIQNHFGCKSGDPCWTKIVGKTVNGDNPIYTYDLDLNKDGIIDQLDVDAMK